MTRIHVTKATVSSACAAIGSLRIPVFVIPGNHDHGGPDSLWEGIAFRFSDDASLDLLSAQLDTMVTTRGDEHLILLSLEGTLGLEAAARLESLLETWKERLVRLKLDQRVTIAPSEDEVAALTRRTEDPLISSVATQLVAKIHGDTEEAAISRLALRELHAAMA
jgi:DNA repair exonuclease SbcCD nuclease subunit